MTYSYLMKFIIVGDSGVGKNAVVYKMVGNIVEGNVPKALKGATVWSLNIAKLISGTKYRGDFEKRMNIIIEELKKDDKNILMIDNIHQILNAGAGSQQGLDVAGLLLPSLSFPRSSNGIFWYTLMYVSSLQDVFCHMEDPKHRVKPQVAGQDVPLRQQSRNVREAPLFLA